MEKKDIVAALMKLLKPKNEDTEDVFYNAGVIDAIKAIERLAGKTAQSKNSH